MTPQGGEFAVVIGDWASAIITPFVQYYHLDAVLTGLILFGVAWALVSRFFGKGE